MSAEKHSKNETKNKNKLNKLSTQLVTFKWFHPSQQVIARTSF